MKNAGAILASLLKELGIEERVRLESMQRSWSTLFPGPVSLHTFPVDSRNGELIVNVDSPAWLQQLKFFKKEMLQKLREHRVTDIRFKHGRIYNPRKSPGKKNVHTPKAGALAGADSSWIDEMTSGIQDPELKESIRKALEKAVTRQAP